MQMHALVWTCITHRTCATPRHTMGGWVLVRVIAWQTRDSLIPLDIRGCREGQLDTPLQSFLHALPPFSSLWKPTLSSLPRHPPDWQEPKYVRTITGCGPRLAVHISIWGPAASEIVIGDCIKILFSLKKKEVQSVYLDSAAQPSAMINFPVFSIISFVLT